MSEARLKRNPFGNPAEGVPGINPLLMTSPQGALRLPPYVDPALLDYLRHTFPVVVGATLDLRAYDRMVGQQAIIAHLKGVIDEQQG